MIRVISGIYKGKRLKKVPSPLVRPMPDKLKTALFNILQEEVRDAAFLDGFAGTGSIGIEALSRGAGNTVFIEEYFPAVKVIKINLARCGAEVKARIIPREFNRAVIQLAKEKEKFDLIFLDPPYELLEERNPLKVIKKREILAPGGKIILRHYFKTKFEAKYFILFRQVTIGDDTLSFFSE
ncbi:MAG: 16S rRNA (guanine(966)-N(2))-methyltransferase RsmD [Candidatus Aminicenantales bacterium]